MSINYSYAKCGLARSNIGEDDSGLSGVHIILSILKQKQPGKACGPKDLNQPFARHYSPGRT